MGLLHSRTVCRFHEESEHITNFRSILAMAARWVTYMIFVTVATAFTNAHLKIFDQCQLSDSDCPDGSGCVFRGCDGSLCICKDNMLPSIDETKCLPGAELNKPCNNETRCRGPFSKCDSGFCRCEDGYVQSKTTSRCVDNQFDNATTADLEEKCDNINVKCAFDLECHSFKCTCPALYRPATEEEIAAYPYKFDRCRPEGYKLGEHVDINGPDCPSEVAPTTKTIVSSTPPTSTMQTTSTSTTSATTASTTTSTPSTTTSTTPSKTTSTTPSTTTSTTPSTIPSTTSSTTPSTTQSTTLSTTILSTTTTQPETTITTKISSTSSTRKTSETTSTHTATSPSSHTTTHLPTPDSVTTTSITITSSPTREKTSTSDISTSTKRSTPSIWSSSTKPTAITKENTVSKSTNTIAISKKTSTESLITRPAAATTSTSINESSSTRASNLSTPLPTQVNIGENCAMAVCPVNAECEPDHCHEDRCRCKLGYSTSPDSKQCWKLAVLGEACADEKICQGPHTQCSDSGVCECEDDYERSDNGRWCRLRGSWFVDFPLVGEACSGSFFSSCYLEFEQKCKLGRCRCNDGMREVDYRDRYAGYPGVNQCRNNSYGSGEREKELCKNEYKETMGSSIYDKAKSKIRKVQGAIIGGCVGFVVLVGILIGVIVMIRFKRRGRRQMIRDTSSTASTDGQTSRYSFKIPRPFATFNGAKEYDANQISYPNSVFDNERMSEPRPDVINVDAIDVDDQLASFSSDNNTSTLIGET